MYIYRMKRQFLLPLFGLVMLLAGNDVLAAPNFVLAGQSQTITYLVNCNTYYYVLGQNFTVDFSPWNTSKDYPDIGVNSSFGITVDLHNPGNCGGSLSETGFFTVQWAPEIAFAKSGVTVTKQQAAPMWVFAGIDPKFSYDGFYGSLPGGPGNYCGLSCNPAVAWIFGDGTTIGTIGQSWNGQTSAPTPAVNCDYAAPETLGCYIAAQNHVYWAPGTYYVTASVNDGRFSETTTGFTVTVLDWDQTPAQTLVPIVSIVVP
jgi:hypothetical protein